MYRGGANLPLQRIGRMPTEKCRAVESDEVNWRVIEVIIVSAENQS